MRNLEQNQFESQRSHGRQTKFVVMATANIPEYFLSSSEDEDEFLGFLPEEINEGRIQRVRADSDVSVDEILSSDEESLEAPIERGETEDEGWSEELTDIFIPPFTEEIGGTFTLDSNATEADFFHKMFPESIYDILATQTNLYALQLQVQRREVDKNWKETTPTEIRRYVGLRIFMSVVHLPDIKMYWSQDRFYGNFAVADVMTRDRFEKISQYLHANDRSGYNREDPDRDKLYLIRPILDLVNKRCLQNYKPHRENAVDEAMVKFRGTLGFRQYMPAKPTKYGIKVWERADSTNGYVCEFEVYVGKPQGGQRETNLGSKVVKRLTRHLKGKNHHIYFDNYFNSVALISELLQDHIYACGTVKSNARGLPNEMRVTRGKKDTQKMQPGDSRIWQKNGVMATTWQEKKGRKPVRLLSSNSNPNQGPAGVRRKQHNGELREVPCPMPVVDYNRWMAAVDRADQMRTAYPTTRKCKRWWTYLLWFCVDLSHFKRCCFDERIW